MSRQNRRPAARRSVALALLALLALVAFALARGPAAWSAAGAEGELRAAWQQAQAAGGYRFAATIDQTLVPVAGAAAPGQTDEKVSLEATGTVQQPDRAEVRIAVGGQPAETAMGLVQDGGRSFLRQGERLMPVENPAGAAAPTGDYLAFLAGAAKVREIAPTAAAGHQFRRFAFDLDGPRLARHLREQLARQMAGRLPAGAQVSPAVLIAQMAGSGTLWVDEQGLPRRQELDLTLPQATAAYSARIHVVTEFHDFGPNTGLGKVVEDGAGGWRLEAPPQSAGSASSGAVDVGASTAVASGTAGLVAAQVVAWTGRLARELPTLAILALVLLFGIWVASYRQRRGVYATIVAVTLAGLIGGPLLQALAMSSYFARTAQAAAANPVPSAMLSAVGAVPGAPGAPAAPVGPVEPLAPMAPGAGPDLAAATAPLSLAQLSGSGAATACGQGGTTADQDQDGLTDFEENCRGTDPYRGDSDEDLISDHDEVTGFSVGGRTWYGDPISVDAGGDGVVDSAEWPAPVGKGLRIDADGDGTITDAEAWDPDGDGVPNIWDEDNDGDGVADDSDLSPFSRSALLPEFTLNTQGGGINGTQYIELQVQPGNPDHLRYTTSVLDWPADSEGQMTDLDNSAEDVRLFPMLEIETNLRPDAELARNYGLGTVESLPGSADPYRLYAPLLPVTENGRMTAFYARVAYPAAQQEQIRWKARMVWVVQGETDSLDGDAVRTDTVPMQTYAEDELRLTGLIVSRSYGFESALIGTPDRPADDRQLFNLLFGLNAAYVTTEGVSLTELANRFSQPLTPPEQKWGVSSPVVLDRQLYAHRDAGLNDTTARRLPSFLSQHYDAADSPAIVTAYESSMRSFSLDETRRLDPGAALNVNLADAPLVRSRGLQLNLYRSEGGSWRSLTPVELNAAVDARYADVSASLAALQPTYPELTAGDLRGVVRLLYTTWSAGRTSTLSVDDVLLTDTPPSDSDLTLRLARDADLTLDAYAIDVAHLARPGGGLRLGGGLASDWQYVRGNFIESHTVGVDFAGMNLYTFETNQSSWVLVSKKLFKVTSAVRDLYQVYQAAEGFQKLSRAQQILNPLTKAKLEGRTMGAIGVVIAVGIIWTTFGLTTDFSNHLAVKLAVAQAVVATVFTVLLFVISLNPVGLVLTLLFALIDLIVFFATNGDVSISDIIILAVARFFYDVEVLTEIQDARFEDIESGLLSDEYGLRAGNAFFMTSAAVGRIRKTSDGDSGDLHDSYVSGRFDAGSHRSEALSVNHDKRCTQSDSAHTDCRNFVGAGFLLTEALRDVDIAVTATLRTKIFYNECGLQGLICERSSRIDTFPDSDDNEPMSLSLDVFPATLDQLWSWDAAPVVGGHVFNADLDGDGLADAQEPEQAVGTWDFDGDGLPDGYERSNRGTLGLYFTVADSDWDGLDDAAELRIGTRADDPDTDADGLPDGDEVWEPGEDHWTPSAGDAAVGGWLLRLPGGPLVPVVSDPLRADSDQDGLNDATERGNQTSPYAVNAGPVLVLSAAPLPAAPAPRQGLFVAPGAAVQLRLDLFSVGRTPIDQPLELCLPPALSGLAGGDLSGDSTVAKAVTAGCGGDPAATQYRWDFSGAASLPVGSAISTTISALAGVGATATLTGSIAARLPYTDGLDRDGNGSADPAEASSTLSLSVDADDPTVDIAAPADGTIFGGGTSAVVVGGSSGDAGSWVSQVRVTPSGDSETAATGVSPWAYTWNLPSDGSHTLSVRAIDEVGHGSDPASVTVIVDNTAPSVAFTTPADGAFVTDASGAGSTVALTGSVSDNLTGVQRVQVQVDDRAWAEAELSGGDRPELPTSASWHFDWRLPGGDAAQGRHSLRVRAFDRATNLSPVAERAITVDVVAPADGLTDRRFETDPPSYGAGQAVALEGLANDAGNVPLAPRPADLAGTLDGLGDATVWLSPETVAEDDAGVSVTWLGDFNGDRLSDLAVGLPGTAEGAGRLAIVYGRPGGWSLPPTPELIADSPTTYVGLAGAGIGAEVAAVGDVNGDGLDDMLVGDPANGRAHLVVGRRGTAVPDALLDDAGGAARIVLAGAGLNGRVAAAGDVNDDGLGDLLVGASDHWYLVLGKSTTDWQPTEDVTIQAAALLAAPAANVTLTGVGDMDGDGFGELVAGDPTGLINNDGNYYLIRGSGLFAATERRALALGATFPSSSQLGRVAALGDLNGDGLADFAYADGNAPKVVFGAAGGNGSCCLSLGGYAPAASGFLSAVGNLDADAAGTGDLLVGAADGSAYLILGQSGLGAGSPAPTLAARLNDVAGAASLAALARSDANADGSSDLVLVPGSAGAPVLETSMLYFERVPHVAADALPRAAPVSARPAARPRGLSPAAQRPDGGLAMNPAGLSAVTRYVDDDWAGTANGADPDGAGPATSFGTNAFATIQAAVNGSAAGDTVHVGPGVYAGFEVNGASKNDLEIVGSNPDAVFVNGASIGGASVAAYVHDATGVALSGLTLRNADRGLWLARAGVGGYSSPLAGFGNPALRTQLARVLVQDCLVGLYTDRSSTVALADSTLVSRGAADRHVQVDTTTPDSATMPTWSTAPADLPAGKSMGDGGSIEPLFSAVRALLGGGSRDFYAYDPGSDSWNTRPSPPLDVVTGSATTVDPTDNLLYLMSRQDRWSGLGGMTGTVDPGYYVDVRTLALSGTNLYAAGTFLTAGGVTANSVARLDTLSGTWSALGQGLRNSCTFNGVTDPCDPIVHASVLDASGNLYIGGFFDTAVNANGSTVAVNGLAKWNGSTWSALGTGVLFDDGSEGYVADLVANGNDIYVSGYFDKAGGLTANSIAKWNGSAWSVLGGGLRRPQSPPDSGTRAAFVWDLEWQGGGLYIGGDFNNTPTHDVARWDGSAYQALGPVSSPLDYVQGLAFLGGTWHVLDWDDQTIYKLASGTWQNNFPAQFDGPSEAPFVVAGGKLYHGFYMAGTSTTTLAAYDGVSWEVVTGNPTANGIIRTVLANGADVYMGGGFTNLTNEDGSSAVAAHIARLSPTPRLLRYPISPTWQPQAQPPFLPAVGSTLAADGAGHVYATFGGHTEFARFDIASDAWNSTLAAVPVAPTTGATSTWADGKLYLLPGDASVNSSAAFYRFTPNASNGSWTAMSNAPFDLGGGADLQWTGDDYLYAVQGGNGRTFARYSIARNSWTVLGSGGTGASTPAGSNPGGGLALFGNSLYSARGGGGALDRYGVVGIFPEKLTLDRVALVSPATSASASWLNSSLLNGNLEPDDYHIGGNGSQWVAGATTSWTPSGSAAPLPMGFVNSTAARFLDEAGGIFRVRLGSSLTAGYHEARGDAHVFPSQAACTPCALPANDPNHLVWGLDAFASIQMAIDSGAPRAVVHAGIYDQSFQLATGVQVIGAGADLSVVQAPVGATGAVARAEGVRSARVARLSLAGRSGVDGLQVEDGARDVTLARAIVRDAARAVRTMGAGTDLEIVNATLVRNGSGLVAEGCAAVDVRNTIFAGNETALAYASCAGTKLHRYNAFWDNTADLAIDGATLQQPGPGELFANPLFTQPAAPVNDFRPADGSPVIDAGNPSDPVPPGTGGRVDIGYVEVHGAAFFADDDYCQFCDNDGLYWGVDAFDHVTGALAAVGDAIAALGCGIGSVGGVPCESQWTVGVGPGHYAEQVSVPSHVSLVGIGADQVTLDGGGTGTPVHLASAVSAEVRGLTLTGSHAAGAGVLVDGTSNDVRVTRNLIRGNAGDGLRFAGRSSGEASFNTVLDNDGAGYHAAGAGTWLKAADSIIADNGTGLRTSTQGQLFDDFNLTHGNGANYSADTGPAPAAGPNSLVGQAPGIVGGGSYALTPASPAVDAADPLAAVPAGGGARSDLGYRELVGTPLALFLGREGISAATGNSGISAVEVGLRRVLDPTLPVTATASLPASWQATTLDTPDQTATYWGASLSPADGDGLYRVYSRALDRAGNRVDDPTAQFRGAFTLDSAAPVVTWLGPAGGSSTTAPLELRAEVADYVAGSFNVATVAFEVDGQRVPAQWAPEPWDEAASAPRVFRAWVSPTATVHTLRAVATDRAGNEGVSSPDVSLTVTGNAAADTTAPTVAITAPADGATVRADVTFSGTVSDASGSGVAGVELSLDGGRAWTPAAVTGGTWQLAWTALSKAEFVSYPVRVRAVDRAGNSSAVQSLAVTIDNVPPAGLAPVTFDLLEGSHTDGFVDLGIDWAPPQSGSGVASVSLAVDQVPDTLPTTTVTGQAASRRLDQPGDWYVHLATADDVGNTMVRHFGPWHVGTVAEAGVFHIAALSQALGLQTVACADRRQTIAVDGVLELDLDEWRADTERLETDERSGSGQTLYFSWDGDHSFLGWQGAHWTLDGTMFAYFDVAAGGTTTPLAAGATAPALPALPFAADYAVTVDSPTEGGLWRWDGSSWVAESLPATDFALAHGEMAGTEVQLPWGAPEVDEVQLFAYAVDNNGLPSSVFPTTNATSGPWSVAYAFADRCDTDPNAGVPRARLAQLAVNSPESALAPWGPDSELRYVVTVDNPEADPFTGARVQLSTTPGAGYFELDGEGSCAGCLSGGSGWLVNLPAVSARASATFTVTGRLAGSITGQGIDVVTTTARLSLPVAPNGASVVERTFAHRVDSRPPTASLSVPGNVIGTAGATILGAASDGDGIGVELVEVRVDGGPWQPATGAALWTSHVVPAGGATSLSLEARATDRYGQTGPVVGETLVVDGVAPEVQSFLVPAVTVGDFADLRGTARDVFPVDAAPVAVEVQVDDEGGPWLAAIVQPAGVGASFSFTWDVPSEDGVAHQLRARAIDAVGNVGQPTAWASTTVFVEPPIEAGPDQLATEGSLVQLAGAVFRFGSSNPYTVTWDFGDGTQDTVSLASPAGPQLDLPATRAYADDGPYTVNLTVVHDGVTLTDSLTVEVGNAAPTVDAGDDRSATEGVVVDLGTIDFHDAGTADTHSATVTWGDGTAVQDGTVNETPTGPPGSVAGLDGTISFPSHVYADDGSYTVEICVTDDDDAAGSGRDCDSSIMTVANLAPTLDLGVDRSASEGAVVALGTVAFHDAGTADTHSVTVSWGDGTTAEAGTVTETPSGPPGSAGGLDGTLGFPSHYYADNGSYSVEVCLLDDDHAAGGDGRTCDTLGLTVTNVAPTVNAGPDRQVYEDDAVTLVASSFGDAGTRDTHVATISWGDGTPQQSGTISEAPFGPPGAVGGASGTATFPAHTYVNPGIHTATVCVTDDDDVAGSGTTCDTLSLAVVHSALRFGAFAVGRDGTSLLANTNVEVTGGGLASNGAMIVKEGAIVSGPAVSVADVVELQKSATVTGGLQSGLDALVGEKVNVTGDVLSGRNAVLGKQAAVVGAVKAVGTVTLGSGATVSGGIQQGATVPPYPALAVLSVSVVAGSNDVTVASGGTQALAPGSYGKLRIRSGGTLSMTVGRYIFASIDADTNAVLALDLAPVAGNATLLIDVAGAISMKDGSKMRIDSAVGDARNILIRSAGGQVQLGKNGAYLGSFVAPAGQLEVGDSSTFTGLLYGLKVTLKTGVKVSWLPALDAIVANLLAEVPPTGSLFAENLAAPVTIDGPDLGTAATAAEPVEVEAVDRSSLTGAVYLPLTVFGELDTARVR